MTQTKSINWNASRLEYDFVRKIVKRAVKGIDGVTDATVVEMDIIACHLNGCPLDLEKLLNAPQFDFAHDICGITRHIDRETGELKNCFVPRCALPEGGGSHE